MNITIEELFAANAHIGHQLRRWNPKFKPYIFGTRQGLSIIDLEKTHACLKEAVAFTKEIAASGKPIIFVGTKHQARGIIRKAARSVQMPFAVDRWMGGMLTNWETSQQSLKKYKSFLEMELNGELQKLPGKEASVIRRSMARMRRNFEGFLELEDLPGAIFIIDINGEAIALAEARRLKIPVIAIVDSNSDPSLVDYPIPANDDAIKTIEPITQIIAEAISDGREQHDKTPNTKVQKREAIVPMRRNEMDQNEAEVTFSEEITFGEPEAEESEALGKPANSGKPANLGKPTSSGKPAKLGKPAKKANSRP